MNRYAMVPDCQIGRNSLSGVVFTITGLNGGRPVPTRDGQAWMAIDAAMATLHEIRFGPRRRARR
jgi:hypothetical protein